MEKQFNNKTIIVTGASSGIGKATAMLFAENGASVVVADVQEDKGNDVVSQINASGGEATFSKCDVSLEKDIINTVKCAVDTYGGLDFAFNNAGIEGDQGAIVDCSTENWDRVLNINLKGTWLCMKHEIPEILKKGGGAIVNCASVAGLVGFPGIPAYVASKHAIVGITKTAALENVKQNIRVNAVCPGVIHTSMIDRFTGGSQETEKQLLAGQPIGRMGRPEEIAETVLWLCSDKASFIVGQAIAADGGWVAQ